MSFKTHLPIKDIPKYDPQNINRYFFTVVWQGNYRFSDYREGVGSHPGVDIDASKYPKGHTPVFAIADGTVHLAKSLTTGFGKHIVIRHDNVPDPDNPSFLTTLFSNYCHLSDIKVKLSQKVKVGQQIGVTGTSGSSTGPHLHFQIDRHTAPSSPFWPFTTAQRKAAGFSDFWAAINSGLGIEKVGEHTCSPLLWVQKFLPENFWFPDVPKTNPAHSAIHFCKSNQIVQGFSDGFFRPDWPVFRSEFLKIILLALDLKIPLMDRHRASSFSDVPFSHWARPFINASQALKAVQGFDDGTFRPEQHITRAEALKVILTLSKTPLKTISKIPFPDIHNSDVWFIPFAQTAKQLKLLDFSDGFFHAEKPITRAETCLAIWRLLGKPDFTV